MIDRASVISNACLPRSDPYPISFRYTQNYYRPDKNPNLERCRQILNLLVNQSTRWRDAYFEVHVSKIPIIYLVKNKLPILRSIKVEPVGGDNLWFTRPDPMFDDLFLDAPQLKRMFIRNPYWKVNWSSLKTIPLSCPHYYAHHLEVLSRASCLEELTFEPGASFLYPISDIVHPTVLPFLKILRSDSSCLFLFKTPLLNELCIKHTIGFFDLNDTLRNYIPSLDHLTHLTFIILQTFDFEIISECTKSCHLKTLTITFFYEFTEDDVDMIEESIRRKSLPKEDHRFDELQCLYLELHEDVQVTNRPSHHFDHFDHFYLLNHFFDQVRRHLDSEDIPYSIQQKHVDRFMMFDVFDD